MTFSLTGEQQHAVDLVRTGRNVAVEALAGTGKTTTLRALADDRPGSRFAYLAFNKSIASEAAGKFPDNAECRTAHAFAYRAVCVGTPFGDRLRADARVPWSTTAQILGTKPIELSDGDKVDWFDEMKVAQVAMQMVNRFCQTGDQQVERKHLPRQDGLEDSGKWLVHDELAAHTLPFARRAWSDLMSEKGRLRFEHGHYLKRWELDGPRIFADVVMLDEAQDSNGCTISIIEQQTDAQVVVVGDARQQIYSWNGATSAMARFGISDRCWLTTSFRFGPEIAAAANDVLRYLSCPVQLTGAGRPGRIGELDRPDAILQRTNAGVIHSALVELVADRRVYVQGGTRDLVLFAEAMVDLIEGRRTNHPTLAAFRTWDAAVTFMDRNPKDEVTREVGRMLGLFDSFGGPDVVIAALKRCNDPRRADVVVSTAHKAKGREWRTVRVGDDFKERPASGFFTDGATEPEAEQVRVMYVAVTRAEEQLDVSLCPFFKTVPPSLPAFEPDATLEVPEPRQELAGQGALF